MAYWLNLGEFGDLFERFERTAFRLEVQPHYAVESEHESVARFTAGQPIPPPEVPEYLEWLNFVRSQTSAGRRIERVRVHAEPPTEYQRWERWAGRWNIEAGEHIRYMTPDRAIEIGLPLECDWWLFDSSRLFKMEFDDDLVLLGGYLTTDPTEVVEHCVWRGLAVSESAPDTGASATT